MYLDGRMQHPQSQEVVKKDCEVKQMRTTVTSVGRRCFDVENQPFFVGCSKVNKTKTT